MHTIPAAIPHPFVWLCGKGPFWIMEELIQHP